MNEVTEEAINKEHICKILVINRSIYFFGSDYAVADYNGRAVFALSNVGIMGSNPTQGMNICVCVYSVFVLSCV
jgi:hypothetical protein